MVCLAPRAAFAYCRATTCETEGACSGDVDESGCSIDGIRLRPRAPCFSFSVGELGSSKRAIDATRFEELVSDAFSTWTDTRCSGTETEGLLAVKFPRAHCRESGFAANGPNQNLFLLRDEDWPYPMAATALAVTFLTVDTETGVILDFDVDFNTQRYPFTLDGAPSGVDLATVVLHELGHVFGLGHSPVTTAVMHEGYQLGGAVRRELDADDRAGYCAVVAELTPQPNCDPEPYAGFSPSCEVTTTGGCNLGRAALLTWWESLGWLSLAILLLRRRAQPKVVRSWPHRCPTASENSM